MIHTTRKRKRTWIGHILFSAKNSYQMKNGGKENKRETKADDAGLDDDGRLAVVHKGRPQKMTHFYTSPPPVRRCPHLTNPPPPHCGRPHLASYTVLWSDSVIAGAVKIRCSLSSYHQGILLLPHVG